MKKEYDFTKGKRGAVLKASRKKSRITIRIDDDVLAWFRTQVQKNRGGSYQTLINEALRSFVDSRSSESEELLRRVLREELAVYQSRKKKS
jgi:uncharacterized protein (DUF4415 family)